jgi:hypothetical protein
MRGRPHEEALETLKIGKAPAGDQDRALAVRSAVQFLTAFTGFDFGEDYREWAKWFDQRGPEYPDDCYARLEEMLYQQRRQRRDSTS